MIALTGYSRDVRGERKVIVWGYTVQPPFLVRASDIEAIEVFYTGGTPGHDGWVSRDRELAQRYDNYADAAEQAVRFNGEEERLGFYFIPVALDELL